MVLMSHCTDENAAGALINSWNASQFEMPSDLASALLGFLSAYPAFSGSGRLLRVLKSLAGKLNSAMMFASLTNDWQQLLDQLLSFLPEHSQHGSAFEDTVVATLDFICFLVSTLGWFGFATVDENGEYRPTPRDRRVDELEFVNVTQSCSRFIEQIAPVLTSFLSLPESFPATPQTSTSSQQTSSVFVVRLQLQVLQILREGARCATLVVASDEVLQHIARITSAISRLPKLPLSPPAQAVEVVDGGTYALLPRIPHHSVDYITRVEQLLLPRHSYFNLQSTLYGGKIKFMRHELCLRAVELLHSLVWQCSQSAHKGLAELDLQAFNDSDVLIIDEEQWDRTVEMMETNPAKFQSQPPTVISELILLSLHLGGRASAHWIDSPLRKFARLVNGRENVFLLPLKIASAACAPLLQRGLLRLLLLVLEQRSIGLPVALSALSELSVLTSVRDLLLGIQIGVLHRAGKYCLSDAVDDDANDDLGDDFVPFLAHRLLLECSSVSSIVAIHTLTLVHALIRDMRYLRYFANLQLHVESPETHVSVEEVVFNLLEQLEIGMQTPSKAGPPRPSYSNEDEWKRVCFFFFFLISFSSYYIRGILMCFACQVQGEARRAPSRAERENGIVAAVGILALLQSMPDLVDVTDRTALFAALGNSVDAVPVGTLVIGCQKEKCLEGMFILNVALLTALFKL
jgi:hypothetical protein